MTYILFEGTIPQYRNFIEALEDKYHITKGARTYEKSWIRINLALKERIA